MPTIHEIAEWIIESYDGSQTTNVERICEAVLRSHGINRFAASTEAGEKASKVLTLLRSMDASSLPFEFSERDPRRLIGKQRIRKDDTPETVAARQALHLVPQMIEVIYSLGDCLFEKICAAMMRLSGADQAFAGCASDDGGIDIYGRIPLRLGNANIQKGILQTAFLRKPLLFLGQCKCYKPDSYIRPEDIEQFHGSINSCMRHYEGNPHPPSHRVPAEYYRREETCIFVFFTTASFTEKAQTAAASHDIMLVNGKELAEYLIHHRIALVSTYEGIQVIDSAQLEPWANSLLRNDLKTVQQMVD